MRVAVNLLWCLPGEVGGSEQYLLRQIIGMREVRPAIDLTLYAPAALRATWEESVPGVRWVDAPAGGRQRWRRVLHEHTWLAARTRDAALAHHGGGTAPRRGVRPFVLTVHDLQYLSFPEYFSSLKRAYLAATVPSGVRRAAVVTVPSQYVRTSVVERLGADPERVVVVPHGFGADLDAAATPADELRSRLGLGDGPVLLYPAMTAPHKNHALLIELLRTVWTEPDLRLVLIGGRGLAAAAVDTAIAAAGESVSARVVRPGRVSDADRNGLLALAEALVFPSRYEGFGAPVVEAMAAGTPVICSDSTCLGEVVGDAAVVRPPAVEAWADALDEVRRRRDDLIERGRRRAASFSLARSGAALAEAYDLAAYDLAAGR